MPSTDERQEDTESHDLRLNVSSQLSVDAERA